MVYRFYYLGLSYIIRSSIGLICFLIFSLRAIGIQNTNLCSSLFIQKYPTLHERIQKAKSKGTENSPQINASPTQKEREDKITTGTRVEHPKSLVERSKAEYFKFLYFPFFRFSSFLKKPSTFYPFVLEVMSSDFIKYLDLTVSRKKNKNLFIKSYYKFWELWYHPRAVQLFDLFFLFTSIQIFTVPIFSSRYLFSLNFIRSQEFKNDLKKLIMEGPSSSYYPLFIQKYQNRLKIYSIYSSIIPYVNALTLVGLFFFYAHYKDSEPEKIRGERVVDSRTENTSGRPTLPELIDALNMDNINQVSDAVVERGAFVEECQDLYRQKYNRELNAVELLLIEKLFESSAQTKGDIQEIIRAMINQGYSASDGALSVQSAHSIYRSYLVFTWVKSLTTANDYPTVLDELNIKPIRSVLKMHLKREPTVEDVRVFQNFIIYSGIQRGKWEDPNSRFSGFFKTLKNDFKKILSQEVTINN